MEAHARAPDPLTIDDDMASNWQSWKNDFIIFMKITGYIDKPNEIRANFLKNRIGKVGTDAIQSISFDKSADKDDMDILIAKLAEYFNPPRKEVVERYHFFTRTKKQNETIEQYINILKDKSKTCNFKDMAESIIRDKIVLDTHDKILRKRFFEADSLDLQKLVSIYNDYNINIEKMKQASKSKQAKDEGLKQVTKENKREEENSMQMPQSANNAKPRCWRCAHSHPVRKCPAWGSKCTKCGDINHFTHCCKDKTNPKGNNKVNKNLLDVAQQPKFVPKNSLPDIPTISGGVVTSPLGNDVTSDFAMLGTKRTSNLNNKNAISRSADFAPISAYSNYSNVTGTKPEISTAKAIYTTANTSTSRMPNSSPRNIPTNKNVKCCVEKKNGKGCVLS